MEQLNVNEREPFYLNEYLNRKGKLKKQIVLGDSLSNSTKFFNLCKTVKEFFNKEWESDQGKQANQSEKLLERQKKAIIGYEIEVKYFKDKIKEYLRNNNLEDKWYPNWYDSLTDGIFHENWGLAGLASWMNLEDSSSAKIIGDRIYYMIDGRQVLQDQRISKERYEQLRKALLLKNPKIRLNQNYAEVYMLSGERIAIFHGDRVKEGQASMIFRRYTVKVFRFEEQARRKTIPFESIPLLESMVDIGFNTAMVGPVRSSKTTFLTTYQSYENPTLEGIMVETDPEIPMHKILPDAPIMQLIADGEELLAVKKSILRGDGDYIIMAEARDGYAFYLAVEAASKGTRRSKLTAHMSDVEDFCYDVANQIVGVLGGNLNYLIAKVAKSFNYIFQFTSLSDRSQKRLKGIYEIRYDRVKHEITIHQICKYDHIKDSWTFKYDIGIDKEEIGREENINALEKFKRELKKLSKIYPMEEDNIIRPVYGKLGGDTNN